MIARGAVLVEKSALLPEAIRLESDSGAGAWARVANAGDIHQLGREIADAGWTFFYMAGTIGARAGSVDSALQRLLRKVKEQGGNCLEIDDVATHSFLGVSRVRVSGHSRKICGKISGGRA